MWHVRYNSDLYESLTGCNHTFHFALTLHTMSCTATTSAHLNLYSVFSVFWLCLSLSLCLLSRSVCLHSKPQPLFILSSLSIVDSLFLCLALWLPYTLTHSPGLLLIWISTTLSSLCFDSLSICRCRRSFVSDILVSSFIGVVWAVTSLKTHH